MSSFTANLAAVEEEFQAIARKIAIASWARYIEANDNQEDEIERQFFSADGGSTRGRGHYGCGQRNQAQIATS
jgi:hypothetical protein